MDDEPPPGGTLSSLADELELAVERSRAQARAEGADPAQATAELQGALATLYDAGQRGPK